MASTAFVGVDLGAGGAPRAPAHVVEPFLGARDASDGSNGGVAALGGGSAAREAALLVELELARLGDSAAGVRDAFNGYRDARDAEGGEVASLARARAAALAEARDARVLQRGTSWGRDAAAGASVRPAPRATR